MEGTTVSIEIGILDLFNFRGIKEESNFRGRDHKCKIQQTVHLFTPETA
jgi:hypothetical protein